MKKYQRVTPNKIETDRRWIFLNSELYGRENIYAYKFQLKVPIKFWITVHGIFLVQMRPFSVFTDVFQDMNNLLRIPSGHTETLLKYGMKFAAQAAKFNSIGPSVSLLQSLTKLSLLSDVSVESSHIISILAADSPPETSFTSSSTEEDYLQTVTY